MSLCLAGIVGLGFTNGASPDNLVPDTPSKAPDYLCTWNLQGYVVSYSGAEPTRAAMVEENLFGKGPYQRWADLFPSIRKDLYFVMDDSWDLPRNVNDGSNPYLGTTELNEERFPSFAGTPSKRLARLVRRMKRLGWKGVGGWICAQKCADDGGLSEEAYWSERLKAAGKAGFAYWKVDWGRQDRNDDWRRMLTCLGRAYAPALWIEHAMKNEYVAFSDVFRTYDVENIIAQPVTINRIAALLPFKTQGDARGMINCEDEPYIAVGLGCAIGIMRHPFTGNLPDGRPDFVFPAVGHNYKACLDEVVRAVRWHRIAEPFAVGGSYAVDTVKLTDMWELRENETWNGARRVGNIVRESAPARVSRGMPLPEVGDTGADRPFVLATTYPNGAVAVAAIGRGIGREYVTKEVPVTVQCAEWGKPVGLFGCFKEVILDYPTAAPAFYTVLAQDLAGDTAVDITAQVRMDGRRLIVPGSVIRKVGLRDATAGDLSGPGMVLVVR